MREIILYLVGCSFMGYVMTVTRKKPVNVDYSKEFLEKKKETKKYMDDREKEMISRHKPMTNEELKASLDKANIDIKNWGDSIE